MTPLQIMCIAQQQHWITRGIVRRKSDGLVEATSSGSITAAQHLDS